MRSSERWARALRWVVIACAPTTRTVVLVVVAILNLASERVSFSRVIAAVPHIYPYHDEPIDFWRFTEHSLRMLFRDFSSVEIRHKGIRRFPKALLVVATR